MIKKIALVISSLLLLALFVPYFALQEERVFNTTVTAQVAAPVERISLVIDFNISDLDRNVAQATGNSSYQAFVTNLDQTQLLKFSASSESVIKNQNRFEYSRVVSVDVASEEYAQILANYLANNNLGQIVQTIYISSPTSTDQLLYSEAIRLSRERASNFGAASGRLVGRIRRVNEIAPESQGTGNIVAFERDGQLFIDAERTYAVTFGLW